LLLLRRQAIADDGAGESALGAQCQLVQRKKSAGRVDALDQVSRVLQVAGFGCGQTQDHRLVFWDVFQRFERTSAFIIVLEQELLGLGFAEDALRDVVVTTLDQPAALLITAAKVAWETNSPMTALSSSMPADNQRSRVQPRDS